MKKQFTRPLHHLAKRERIKELKEMYVFNLLHPQPEPLRILVIDDIVTTGATMNAISQSIRKTFPAAELYFFTFAKTKDRFV